MNGMNVSIYDIGRNNSRFRIYVSCEMQSLFSRSKIYALVALALAVLCVTVKVQVKSLHALILRRCAPLLEEGLWSDSCIIPSSVFS